MFRIHDHGPSSTLGARSLGPVAAAIFLLFIAATSHALPPIGNYGLQLMSAPPSVGEGDGNLTLFVEITNASCSDPWSGIDWDARIDYTIGADMSDLGDPIPATVFFSDTNLVVMVTIPIVDDVIFEGDELFELVLEPGMNPDINCPILGGTIEPSQADFRFQFLLTDNDPPGPPPHLTMSPQSVTEDAGVAVFDVNLLDPPAAGTVTVEVLTEDGSAIAGQDYTAVPTTTLSFPPGTVNQQVSVNIIDDSTPEGVEEFFFKMQNPVGATLDITFVDGEINDNDPFLLSIQDTSITETDPGDNPNVMVTVELSPPAVSTVSVDFATSDGTAVDPQDYLEAMGTVTFNMGDGSKTISVPIIGDSDIEGDEKFFVDIFNPMGADIDDDQAEVEIIDNDFPAGPEFIVKEAPAAAEGDEKTPGHLTFLVEVIVPSQSEGVVQVDFETVDGDAIAGQDYVATSGTVDFVGQTTTREVIVNLIGDDVVEDTETLSLVISNPVGATISVDKAVGTIIDDDETQAPPELTVSDVTVEEGDEGLVEALFTLRLSRPVQTPTQVSFATADVSAAAGEDYQPRSGVLVFAPGELQKRVSVPVRGDLEPEDDETFELRLSDPFGLILERISAVATILNDDEPAAPQLAIRDAQITEGDGGDRDLIFVVSLTPIADGEISVDFSTEDGSATDGADYRSQSGTLTFAAGESERTITVPVISDDQVEDEETFTVTLSNPDGAEIQDGEATGTIIDDDQAPPPLPEIAINNISVQEGDEGTTLAVFTVGVIQRTKNVIQVDYQTVDGTALAADGDYVATSGRLILESGQREGTIEVQVLGDTRVEDNERFALRISAPEGAVIAQNVGVCTIVNDDQEGGGGGGGGGNNPSTVRLLPTEPVTEGDGPAQITVERLGDTSGSATAVLTPVSGGATAGQDFQGGSQQVSWGPGESGPRQVSINILDDNIPEPTEAFGVAISQAQGAAIGNPRQVAVQILDEDTPMRLEVIGDQDLTAAVRSELQLQVRVLRQDGAPVQGALVRWQAEGRATTAGQGVGRSDDDGLVTQGILLARTPGQAQVIAQLAGTEASVAFNITVEGDLMGGIGPGGDSNEGGVASALDQSCADSDGEISELCDFIFGIDDPTERNEVLARATPKGALARNRAALQGPKTQARNVGSRMQALRAGGGRTVAQLAMSLRGDSLSLGPLQEAIAGAAQGHDLDDRRQIAAKLAQAVDAARGDDDAILANEDEAAFDAYDSTESPWGFFLNGRASFGEAPRRGVEPSYDFETDGLSAGVDYRVSDRLVIGAALGYLRSDTEVEAGRGAIDMEGYSLTLYATYFKEAFYLEGALTYGASEYDIERVILLPRAFRGVDRLNAVGSPDSNQLSLTAAAGYDFRVGPAATLSGFIRGSYIESTVDAYAETGALAFNIAYEDQDIESLLGEVGVELLYPFSFSWGVLQPVVRVAFLHEFEDGVETVRARFVGDTRGRVFNIESERPDRDFFNVAAGFTATLQRGWATYFQYDTDLERDDLDIYTLSGGVRFQF